jgi:hypothetical protein
MTRRVCCIPIPPARVEAEYIERTLPSLVGRTDLPLFWAIVRDDSTEGTGEIAGVPYYWSRRVQNPERSAGRSL